MSTRTSSIATKLSAYIMALATLTFILVAVVFYTYSRQREEKQAVGYSSLQLENILHGIDMKLSEVEHITAMTSTSVGNLLNTPDSLMPVIEKMVAENPKIMGGCVAFEPYKFKSKGRFFMEYVSKDSTGITMAKHLGSEEYNYHTMSWYTEPKKSGKGSWSEPYFDDGGGERVMTTYSLPLRDNNGCFIGVLTADVALEDFVKDLESLRPYPDSYTTVISRKGLFIAHPDKDVVLHQSLSERADELQDERFEEAAHRIVKHESGSLRLELNGKDELICYSPLLRSGWSVCYVCPYDNIMKTLGNTMLYGLLILVAGLLVMLVCTRYIILGVTRPVTQLTEAAYRIAQGRFDAELPPIKSRDEMGRLREAFAHMQTSLTTYISELTEATRAKERIASELNVARKIQMGLVPRTFSPFAECKSLELFGALKPAKEVGGDFYDFFFRDDKLFFAIGDVSGKGIPASLVMSITRTLFRIGGGSEDAPETIVNGINKAMSVDNEANMFVTMFVGVLDLESHTLSFCNAGHNPPFITNEEGTCVRLPIQPNIPIGVMPDFVYSGEKTIMSEDSLLLLYTDGLVEAENTEHKQFGEQRVTEVLSRAKGFAVKEIVESLINEVAGFEHPAEQFDDLTLLALRLKSRHSKPGNVLTRTIKERVLMLENRTEELTKLQAFLQEVCGDLSLSASLCDSLNVALEEAVVNIINYGYPEGTTGFIQLTAEFDAKEQCLIFTLSDNGKPFNPLGAEDADTESALQDRKIGGLGIFLMRRMMDDIRYSYADGQNQLRMVKRVE